MKTLSITGFRCVCNTNNETDVARTSEVKIRNEFGFKLYIQTAIGCKVNTYEIL